MKAKLFSRLTRRTIFSNFRQFVSVILIVLLATMLLSGFITNSSILETSIDRYFSETNLADLWLYVDGVSEQDEEFLKSNDITYNKRLYMELSGRIEEKNIQNHIKVYVADEESKSYSGVAISNPYWEAGLRGCLIDKRVASDMGLELGYDQLEFSYDFEANIMGMPITVPIDLAFTITGTMSLDECADTYSSWPVYIDEAIFKDTLYKALVAAAAERGWAISYEQVSQFVPLPFNQILVKTENTKETSELLSEYFEGSDTKLVYLFTRDQIESVVLLSAEIDQSKKMIYVFPIIFLIVSVLVILTTINQLVIQERQRIGTLKSIGIRDGLVLYHYSKYGAVLCLLGSVLGIVLGVLIIPNIMFIKYNLVYSIPSDYVKLNVPIWWLLLVLAAMVIMGFVVSLSACFNILHKKPTECLRQDIGHVTKLRNKKNKKKRNLPIPIKMAARNLRLKPIRLTMVTIGIAGCMALLLCGFGIGDTLTHSINSDMGETFYYDISSSYTEAQQEEFLGELEANQSVEFYEKVDTYFVEALAGDRVKNISVYQICENSKFTKIQLSGDEAWISKEIAGALGVGVGDEIEVSLAGSKCRVKIDNIIDTCAINGLFVCRDLGLNGKLATKNVWIKSKDISNEFIRQLNSINGTDGAMSMQQKRDSAFDKVSSIDLMTSTLETFAILLAIIVLFNLIFLIIKERTREIATLKVLGTGLFDISLTIFYEIMFMATFGSILGMCLGFPLLILVLKINKVEIINYLYYISPLSFVYAILIIFLTIFVVCALSTIKVKKINMIESLKSVE